jgi:hypothetical protein
LPQFDRPGAANYTTVRTTGEAKVRAWFDATAYIRPWKAAVVIRVYDGSLAPGDQVIVTFGDRSGGGPGAQAQTFPEETFEFRVAVDAFGTGQYVALPDSPALRITGGSAIRLRVMAPSGVVAGQPFAITIKAEDRWGNPSASYAGEVTVESDDPAARLPAPARFAPDDRGARRLEGIALARPGLHRLTIRDDDGGLVAESNPIVCAEAAPAHALYWGDPHGQTEMAVGTGSVEEYFAYGRDVAGLDFLAHCANDFQIDADDHAETCAVVKRYHQPGRFVTFPAYEWSGNTPAGGDHNVYFLRDDPPIHRSSHWQIEDKRDEETDRYPITHLHETFRGRDDVLILPHIGGRRANLDFHDPAFGPVIEIQSIHGLFWWFAEEALRRGLRVGFIAGSDDHSGRPGSTFPSSADIHFGMRGGLTGVYAADLTREAIWEAIKARRCYGTTGERIIVDLSADGHPMGADYRASAPPRLAARVIGTAPLERVELWRGLDCLYRHPLAPVEPGRRLQIVWSGARVMGRNRETHWDGELTLTGGRIIAVREFAFDGPRERVVERGESRVTWHSSTCGDADGLLLDVALSGEAVLRFTAGPCRFALPLTRLGDTPHIVEAGGVEQRVEVAWAPTADRPREVAFEHIDETIQPGVNPYYLRIRQIDGALAWSSPIYVDY